MSLPTMKIVPVMKEKCDTVTVSVTDFLKQQASMWGKESYNVLEMLGHGMKLTPYFDFDAVYSTPPADTAPIRQKCIDALTEIFKGDDQFDVDHQGVIQILGAGLLYSDGRDAKPHSSMQQEG